MWPDMAKPIHRVGYGLEEHSYGLFWYTTASTPDLKHSLLFNIYPAGMGTEILVHVFFKKKSIIWA
jgi:hypothetical protein